MFLCLDSLKMVRFFLISVFETPWLPLTSKSVLLPASRCEPFRILWWLGFFFPDSLLVLMSFWSSWDMNPIQSMISILNGNRIQDILTLLTDNKCRLEASDSHRRLGVIAELGRPLPAPPEPRVLHIIHDHWWCYGHGGRCVQTGHIRWSGDIWWQWPWCNDDRGCECELTWGPGIWPLFCNLGRFLFLYFLSCTFY